MRSKKKTEKNKETDCIAAYTTPNKRSLTTKKGKPTKK